MTKNDLIQSLQKIEGNPEIKIEYSCTPNCCCQESCYCPNEIYRKDVSLIEVTNKSDRGKKLKTAEIVIFVY